ncbi:hypothetical protein VTI74DRAFT_4072 [Chaetomium olivicolor]
MFSYGRLALVTSQEVGKRYSDDCQPETYYNRKRSSQQLHLCLPQRTCRVLPPPTNTGTSVPTTATPTRLHKPSLSPLARSLHHEDLTRRIRRHPEPALTVKRLPYRPEALVAADRRIFIRLDISERIAAVSCSRKLAVGLVEGDRRDAVTHEKGAVDFTCHVSLGERLG